MAGDNRKPESQPNDPEEMTRLLELELMQKRAAWQEAGTRRSSLRTVSICFLFVVVIAAMLAFYFLLSSGRLDGRRAPQGNQSPPAETPGSPDR